MRTLIVVRHGEYGSDLRLCNSGRRQMEDLAQQLRPYTTGCRVRMLASSAPRASDSGTVLAAKLELDGFEQHEILWSDNDHYQDDAAVLALIREKFEGVDVLIIVTHLEYAETLPTVFGQEVLGVRFKMIDLGKGRCRVVCCEKKTAILL